MLYGKYMYMASNSKSYANFIWQFKWLKIERAPASEFHLQMRCNIGQMSINSFLK